MDLKLGRTYTREALSDALGGSQQAYLPRQGAKVLYAAVTRESNPEAPRVILAGDGPEIAESARLFAQQSQAVPVFIKQEVNAWEFVGSYRVRSSSENPTVLEEYRRRSGREDRLTRVLFLEMVGIKSE